MQPVQRLKLDDFKKRQTEGIFAEAPLYVRGYDYRLAEKLNEIMDVLGIPEPEKGRKREKS